MHPENKGFCDLIQSLGGAGKVMTVTTYPELTDPWCLHIDMRRPSIVEGEDDKFDLIICALHRWRYIRTEMDSFSGLWTMISQTRKYVRWNRDVYAWSEHESEYMIQ